MDFFTHRGAVLPIGDLKAAPATVDQYGAVSVTDQATRWLFEGRVFSMSQGVGSTEADFAKVAFDENQPQITILVPNGTACVPIGVSVSIELQEDVPGHIVLGYTSNNIGNGTSTSVTVVPMRTDAPRGAQCTARSLYTGNSSALTNVQELHRWTLAEDKAASTTNDAPDQNFTWGIRTHSVPLLMGDATFIMWIFTETTSDLEGYVTVTWAEFNETDIVA